MRYGWRWAVISGAFLSLAAIAQAQTFTTLATFNLGNGADPELMALVQGTNGAFYGTTQQGGSGGSAGMGTVFAITPAGVLTTLHTFTGPDGASPFGGLVLAADGTLYGMTTFGGANTCVTGSLPGCGTIFQITEAGAFTTLHNFAGTDGSQPYDTLIQTSSGSFFGTTYAGGPSDNYGTIFEFTPPETVKTLYSFLRANAQPISGLIQTSNGIFYGATGGGTASGSLNPNGQIFSFNQGVYTNLYAFGKYPNGKGPSGLIQASDGNFYGTTYYGGGRRSGTVFKITPAGVLTTLYQFCSQSGCTDGSNPIAGLIQATDGNLYGTTSTGGAHPSGTIFRITLTGTLTTLHSFSGTDGSSPSGALVQGTDGNFYGTTTFGGPDHFGTVFRLSTGLAPFVETVPPYGKVGTAIRILGTNLTGASSVTFNGVAAAFTVVAASEITTTVPDGATTGTVRVTTPGGTLLSNVPFRVGP